ncbi:MAG: hypothetical protein WDM91_17180 [Rhizomicrobium sp.]
MTAKPGAARPVDGIGVPEPALAAQILRERVQDMGQRRVFADRAFVVTMCWLVFLFAFAGAQVALSAAGHGLDDAQFIAVVTSTTAIVFGVWMLVGRYLFGGR